jgi:iduronate 2-sulfatase
MPEYCPSKYWDIYQPQALTLAPNPRGPTDAPQIAVQTSKMWRNWLNLSSQTGLCQTDYAAWQKPPCIVEDSVARTMRWAYYACISYTDANIGAVVGSLTQLGFTASTVIVVWGDHVRASTLCKTPCFLCSCQGARSGLLQLLCTLHL